MKRIILTLLLTLSSASLLLAQDDTAIDSIATRLQEVVITARQPATKVRGNTLVSTIAGSRLQDLGTCLDVLAQLPMLTVTDADVQVTGKGSPEIYIDGRPLRDATELQLLMSDNIRRVELNLAPGALYASDTRAVLNIFTKRSFIDGLSLTERAQVTARRKWSADDLLDLNYRSGRWDIFASGTVARNNSLIKGYTINTLQYDGHPTTVGSAQHNTYPTTTGTVKAGFNFADGTRSYGAYYRFNPERGSFTNTGCEWIDNDAPADRDINLLIRSRSHLVSAYYDDTFADRYRLHFDGNFRSSSSTRRTDTSYPAADIPDVASTDHSRSTLWAAKAYLSFPMWGGSLVTGTQDSYTRTRLDYRMLNDDVSQYIPSSLTDTRQTSLAAFASWEKMAGPFSISAGIRYEYVDYTLLTDGKKDTDVSRTDHLITPDVSLSWSGGEESQLALSYRMATIRPPYSQLTGSLSYVGRHEIEGGNPALRDEHMHDVQISGMWNGFMLQADYTRSIDTYAFVKKLYPAPTLQLLMQPVNINVSALSLYLIWSKGIKAWSPNYTVGIYRQWLTLDATRYNRPIFSYYLENAISLPRGFLLTVNTHGNSGGYMHTNRFGASWSVTDMSVVKHFSNKAIAVTLTVTDLFNTSNNDWSMYTYGILTEKHQVYDHRGIALSIRYQLHPRPSKYKGKMASESEINRF